MQQLLSIETVPISIEYKSNKPVSVTLPEASTKLSISAENKKYVIKGNSIKINFDKFVPSKNTSYTYNASASYSESGSIQLDIQLLGETISDIGVKRIERSMGNVMDQLTDATSSPVPVNDMRINFEMSGLPADWGIFPRPDVSFVPGNLEFEIKEYPKLIIKYVGKPLYIPRSSDPDYIPEKFDTTA